jgi:hypothetical protein|tara:strand:- start:1317 stop:2153 length:837 start_codon:yes stop_codon:yes gene_type:complete
MISEQDNSPEEVKGRVRSVTKAIRYKAKQIGGNMIKAFNDYMGSQGGGIGAQERQMIKKSLGLSEKFSNWREDLYEIDIPGEKKMDVKIKEKKITNKIKINPNMGEEIEKLGGTILEMSEVEEEAIDPAEKQKLMKKKQLMQKQQMLDKQRIQAQMQGRIPTGHRMEGYDKPDEKLKTDRDMFNIPKSEKDAAKARLLAKTKAIRKAKMKEELSVDDQMKISQKYNRMTPEQKKAANKKAVAGIPKVAPKKDTRTDAQKMADAYASPRKGPGGATRAD